MKFVLIIFLSILITNISAITITEVELNPIGDDAGNEWIEFYSENEINMSGYRILNNDGDEIEINFSFSGYYVYTLEKQWLDNSDEKVFLYFGENLTYETEIFADSANNDFTWQFCNSWVFLNSTKGQKCIEQEENNQENETENSNDEEDEEEEEDEEKNNKDHGVSKNINDVRNNFKEFIYEEDIEKKIISVSQTIKSENNNEKIDKSTYANYGLAAFCLLLLILFIKNKKSYKNEFR